jgi:hypothetical protein
MKRTSSISIELNKRGRRTYGATYTLPDGRRCYLAWRRIREIYRAGEKDISTAIRLGTAAWAIDDRDLIRLKVTGVRMVGVLVKETADVYLTDLRNYFDKNQYKMLNFTSKGGSLQRFLPLDRFTVKTGSVKI